MESTENVRTEKFPEIVLAGRSRTSDFADGPITLAAMIMFGRKQGQQVRRMRHLRLVQCPPSGLR